MDNKVIPEVSFSEPTTLETSRQVQRAANRRAVKEMTRPGLKAPHPLGRRAARRSMMSSRKTFRGSAMFMKTENGRDTYLHVTKGRRNFRATENV